METIIKTGCQLISEERTRQIAEEGWDTVHDRGEHPDGELALAAIHYACPSAVKVMVKMDANPSCYLDIPDFIREETESLDGDSIAFLNVFPPLFTDKKDKHDRIRQLVIAGALIAAEIDRLLTVEGK